MDEIMSLISILRDKKFFNHFIDVSIFDDMLDDRIDVDRNKLINSFLDNIGYVLEYKAVDERILGYCRVIKNYEKSCWKSIGIRDLICAQILLVIFLAASFEEKEIDDFLTKTTELKATKRDHFYRGQSNYDFGLLPSMYRKYKNGNKTVLYNDIIKKYIDTGLIELYNSTIGETKTSREFFAFMQHSCSCSPFLDFSDLPIVALVFATHSNKNKEAAFFDLKLNSNTEQNKIQNEFSLLDLKVEIFNQKINNGTKINNKPIYYCTVTDFVPEIFIIDKKDNDRMKYQKGDFLVFKRCVFINGIPLIPLGFGKLTKYRIPYASNVNNGMTIDKIKRKHLKNKEYNYKYLMNPYLIFEEHCQHVFKAIKVNGFDMQVIPASAIDMTNAPDCCDPYFWRDDKTKIEYMVAANNIKFVIDLLEKGVDIHSIKNNKSLSDTVDKYFSPNLVSFKGSIIVDLYEDGTFHFCGIGIHRICAAAEQNCDIPVIVCDLSKTEL